MTNTMNSQPIGDAADKHQGKPEKPGAGLVASLRRMMPLRPLAPWEHRLIAEHQASRLLNVLDQTQPGVSLDWLSDGSLGNVTVVLTPRWRMEGLSGMSTWEDGRWVIGVNKGNPPARRRFTLCHEFKHVLDANRDEITYRRITDPQREQIADYFAACYLMPKVQLRRAWTGGLQDPEALAGLFKVSNEAMRRRLKHLQYLDSEPDRPVTSYFRRQSERMWRVVGSSASFRTAVQLPHEGTDIDAGTRVSEAA